MSKKVYNGCIQGEVLWRWIQPLCQMCLNNCPWSTYPNLLKSIKFNLSKFQFSAIIHCLLYLKCIIQGPIKIFSVNVTLRYSFNHFDWLNFFSIKSKCLKMHRIKLKQKNLYRIGPWARNTLKLFCAGCVT